MYPCWPMVTSLTKMTSAWIPATPITGCYVSLGGVKGSTWEWGRRWKRKKPTIPLSWLRLSTHSQLKREQERRLNSESSSEYWIIYWTGHSNIRINTVFVNESHSEMIYYVKTTVFNLSCTLGVWKSHIHVGPSPRKSALLVLLMVLNISVFKSSLCD